MPAIVVADADVLFGGATRALLIYLDYAGAIRLHCSPLILAEMSPALFDTERKVNLATAQENEVRMNQALAGANIPTVAVQRNLQQVQHAVKSAKDAHVAAAAYTLLADEYYPHLQTVGLVSRNLPDYDIPALQTLGVLVQHPDPFLLALTARQQAVVAGAFRAMRLDLASKPTPDQLLVRLANDGQKQTAAALAALEQATPGTL